jgi:hypothetical protein
MKLADATQIDFMGTTCWTWDAKAVANLIGNFLNMLLGHPGDLGGSYRLVVNNPCE